MEWHETRQFLSPCFPEPLQRELDMLLPGELREIRLRTNRPCVFVTGTRTAILDWQPTQMQLETLAEALSEHSLYARSDETSQGFITLRGGHRMGLCGSVLQRGSVRRLKDLGSVCIRIACQWPGAADAVIARTSTLAQPAGVLIIGPPGSGKTTILRDLARQLSGMKPMRQTALIDERGELSAPLNGVPQLDVGASTDVLDGLNKQDAFSWLIRSMSPEVIITDELTSAADAQSVLDTRGCGVAVCASVHGRDLHAAAKRPFIADLMAKRAFDLYAVLSPEGGAQVTAMYDRSGSVLS